MQKTRGHHAHKLTDFVSLLRTRVCIACIIAIRNSWFVRECHLQQLEQQPLPLESYNMSRGDQRERDRAKKQAKLAKQSGGSQRVRASRTRNRYLLAIVATILTLKFPS